MYLMVASLELYVFVKPYDGYVRLVMASLCSVILSLVGKDLQNLFITKMSKEVDATAVPLGFEDDLVVVSTDDASDYSKGSVVSFGGCPNEDAQCLERLKKDQHAWKTQIGSTQRRKESWPSTGFG